MIGSLIATSLAIASAYMAYTRYKKNMVTLIFLDVDGTITQIPGHKNGSLFQFAPYYQDNPLTEEGIEKLYKDEESYNRVKKFLTKLQNLPYNEYKCYIVSNNFHNIVETLLYHHFDLQPDHFMRRCYTRECSVGMTKQQFIKDVVEEHTKFDTEVRAFFFDDDPRNVQGLHPSVKWFDCGDGQWLGEMLEKTDLISQIKYE